MDRSGRASAYGRNRHVGTACAERVAHVRYDPQQPLWLFQDGEGDPLNRRKAAEINAANIPGLMEANRRNRSGVTGEGKLGVGITAAQLDVG